MRKGIKSEESRLTFGSTNMFLHRDSLSLSVACSFCWCTHCSECVQRYIHTLTLLHAFTCGFSQMTPYEDLGKALKFFVLPSVLHAYTFIPSSYSKCSLKNSLWSCTQPFRSMNRICKSFFEILKGRIFRRLSFCFLNSWCPFTSFHLKAQQLKT